MPDLVLTLLFPSNIYQSAKFCLFVFLSFLYVYLHSDDNADNDGDDDDTRRHDTATKAEVTVQSWD